MLGRDNGVRLLKKPAGFYPRVSKRVPVGKIPAGITLPAGTWAFSDSANGYTRGGHTRRIPGYFLRGVQL